MYKIDHTFLDISSFIILIIDLKIQGFHRVLFMVYFIYKLNVYIYNYFIWNP